MTYYQQCTDEEFKTTVDSHNRQRDKEYVEGIFPNLSESGDNELIMFTKSGLNITCGYLRILYGDHGPYFEYLPEHIIKENWRCTRRDIGYYNICQPVSGKACKLYHQIKDVKHLPNPPAGFYSVRNNRPEGYADYRVGRLYISVDDVTIK